MLSGLELLWDSCERAEFCQTGTTNVSISVTGCKVTKCYVRFNGQQTRTLGAGKLKRDVGSAGGS